MSINLLDWRRQVGELYRVVRSSNAPAEAHAVWRARRDQLFASHPASPVPAHTTFAGLSYGSYDAAYRFEVPVETDLPPHSLQIVTGTDGMVPLHRFGRVHLEGLGQLDVWWLGGYGGGVFVPFSDPSPSNYGGGRYVLDTVKGADLGGAVDPATGRGTLVVDLNFAYNPSCAYDPSWACPLAPIGNRLPEPVLVGERLPEVGTLAGDATRAATA
jgi:uncharacterized protein